MAHDAFISYSRQDKAFAKRLQQALASYTPPKGLSLPDRPLDVFRDEDDFTGAEYYQALEQHLEASNKLVVLCSPAARASTYVNDEIERFARAKGAHNIVALLVAGVPNNEVAAGEEAQQAFPQALCELMTMPLAADYRHFDLKRSRIDRGAYEASWYTTLANICGTSRAEIEERDRKRRALRMRVRIGASVAAVLVLSTVSLVALDQRLQRARQDSLAAARKLAADADAIGRDYPGQRLELQALTAARSLRLNWTPEGYRAWRQATLRMPRVVAGVETDSPLLRMAFSADATRLFALCGKRHLHVFSVPELRELQRLDAEQTAFELAIDTAGRRALAYQSGGEFVEVFDTASGTKTPLMSPGSLHAAGFDRSGDAIIVSKAGLWVADPASADGLRARAAFPPQTLAVALAPDRATVLALGASTLQAYDTTGGALRWQLPLGGDDRAMAFSGDGRSALVTGPSVLTIVDAATGQVVESREAPSDARGRPLLLSRRQLAIGNSLLSAEGRAQLPFAAAKTPLSAFPAVDPTGRYLAGIDGRDERRFIVADVSRSRMSASDDEADFYLSLREAHQGLAAAFSADGHLLVLSSRTPGLVSGRGALQLVSLRPERWRSIVPTRSFTGDVSVLPPDARVVARPLNAGGARSFDAEGTAVEDDGAGSFVSVHGRLAARVDGANWVVTDRKDGRRISIPHNNGPIVFSPDERRVLVFPAVYSLDGPASPRTVAGAGAWHQAWSYPGSTLVIGLERSKVHMGGSKESVLFDWTTETVSAGPGSVNALYAVGPDGKRFVTYTEERGIAMWERGAGVPLQDGRAPSSADVPPHFSPDGRLIALAYCPAMSVPLFATRPEVGRFEALVRLLSGGGSGAGDPRPYGRSFTIPLARGCFAGFTLDGAHVLSRAWHAGYPQPTAHPITWTGVQEETCAKVRTGRTAEEWARPVAGDVLTALREICPARLAQAEGGVPPGSR